MRDYVDRVQAASGEITDEMIEAFHHKYKTAHPARARRAGAMDQERRVVTLLAERGIATAMRPQDEPTREALRALRQDLIERRLAVVQPEPVYYAVTRSSRPANAVVPLVQGTGQDPAAVARALNTLKRRLDQDGVSTAIKRADIAKKSERTKIKRHAAARRRSRAQWRYARLEAEREARGAR